MIHSKAVDPRVYPINGDFAPAQIDRAQDLGGDLTLNREKVNEIGRDGAVGYRKQTPAFKYTLRQFEYGNMEFWNKIANNTGSVELGDFKTSKFDMAAFLTDDNDVFKGTLYLPNLRVNGFGINIGSPDASIERNFDFLGEDYQILKENYLAFEKVTVATSAPSDEVVVLSPVPVEYADGKYILRVARIRAGVTSILVEGTDDNEYSFAAPASVTVRDCEYGDIIKVYYVSATASETIWANNDVDVPVLSADCADIYLKVGVGDAAKMYRVQSASMDITFDRADYREIGNKDIVQTGIKSNTVSIKLGRLLEDFTIEEALASTTGYPLIDAREFSDEISIIVKVYEDNTKTTFKMGYKAVGLTPTALANSTPVEDYTTMDTTLEGESLIISSSEGDM
jgi:hypothetical protein